MTNYMDENRKREYISKLALCLKQLAPTEQKQIRYTEPAQRILDCILSLNRRYLEFVVPTIDSFINKYPSVSKLSDLHDLVKDVGGPYKFFRDILDYDDKERAETFFGVLIYLLNVLKQYDGSDDLEKLNRWAISVKPSDYRTMLIISDGKITIKTNVPGFGIAGWQYLRMLFGADTCKPDIKIKGFIKDCLGIKYISEQSAVELMEAAALVSGLSVKEADRRIWHANKSYEQNGNCH